ncbi:hypothetical protein ACFP8W_00500, partial [Nocardioides hankookensis]
PRAGRGAQRRFAAAAAEVLAERVDGRPRDWYADQIAGWSTTPSTGASGSGLSPDVTIGPA